MNCPQRCVVKTSGALFLSCYGVLLETLLLGIHSCTKYFRRRSLAAFRADKNTPRTGAKSRNREIASKRCLQSELNQPSFWRKKKRKKQRALPLLRWVPLVQVCAAKKARQRALLPKPADPCATNEGKNTAAAVGDGWSALQIKSTLSLIRAHNPPVNHTGGFSGLEDFLDFEIFWTNGTQQRTATCSV